MSLRVVPLGLREANAYIEANHRHHKKVQGHRFSIGAIKGETLVGVAVVGRPVSRYQDDGYTVEVTRLCTDGSKDVCSFLYGATARIAKEMGFERIITYTLDREPGTSLRAAGWCHEYTNEGGSWSSPSRPRTDKAPTVPKKRWSRTLIAKEDQHG